MRTWTNLAFLSTLLAICAASRCRAKHYAPWIAAVLPHMLTPHQCTSLSVPVWARVTSISGSVSPVSLHASVQLCTCLNPQDACMLHASMVSVTLAAPQASTAVLWLLRT